MKTEKKKDSFGYLARQGVFLLLTLLWILIVLSIGVENINHELGNYDNHRFNAEGWEANAVEILKLPSDEKPIIMTSEPPGCSFGLFTDLDSPRRLVIATPGFWKQDYDDFSEDQSCSPESFSVNPMGEQASPIPASDLPKYFSTVTVDDARNRAEAIHEKADSVKRFVILLLSLMFTGVILAAIAAARTPRISKYVGIEMPPSAAVGIQYFYAVIIAMAALSCFVLYFTIQPYEYAHHWSFPWCKKVGIFGLVAAFASCVVLLATTAVRQIRAAVEFAKSDPEISVSKLIVNLSQKEATRDATLESEIKNTEEYIQTLRKNGITTGLTEAERKLASLIQAKQVSIGEFKLEYQTIINEIAEKRKSRASLRNHSAPQEVLDAVVKDIRVLRGRLEELGRRIKQKSVQKSEIRSTTKKRALVNAAIVVGADLLLIVIMIHFSRTKYDVLVEESRELVEANGVENTSNGESVIEEFNMDTATQYEVEKYCRTKEKRMSCKNATQCGQMAFRNQYLVGCMADYGPVKSEKCSPFVQRTHEGASRIEKECNVSAEEAYGIVTAPPPGLETAAPTDKQAATPSETNATTLSAAPIEAAESPSIPAKEQETSLGIPLYSSSDVSEAGMATASRLNEEGMKRYSQKDWSGAAELFIRALETYPGAITPRYNLACVYSLSGEADKAIAVLQQFKDAGCEKCLQKVEAAKTDKDFDSIRNEPGFIAVVGD